MATYVLTILVLFLVVSHVQAGCDRPWIKKDRYCYLFHNVTATLYGHNWDDSQQICLRYGGDLLSIADQTEQNFITLQFQDPFIKRNHYWIGLNDRKIEGTYEWSDSTPYNKAKFSNWRTDKGEPNNWNNEDCAETTWDGRWNDNGCFRELGFICKRKEDATPLPTPIYPPPPNVTTQPTTCEAGWLPWRTSCYGIIRGLQKSWSDAQADCLRRFGDLVVVDDQQEQDFLTNQIAKSDTQYWIGLSDKAIEGTFHWVDNLNFTFKNWGPNEPSNDYGNEDCVEMYGKWNPGKWNDNYCSSRRDYICEKKNGLHNCPDGWSGYKDYCYQINSHPNQRTSWQQAQLVCWQFNQRWKDTIDVAKADLVSIASQEEQDMLVKAFKDNGVTDYGSSFWTGFNSINASTATSFFWSDKSVSKYRNFKEIKTTTSYRCVKSSLDDSKGRWYTASCTDKNYYACKVKKGKDRCYSPMGIQNYRVPDSSMTASGQLSQTTPAAAARLYSQRGNSLDGAWCESNTTKIPWLQINFGSPQRLTYMAVQGKSYSDAVVTTFYLKYSMDGVSWDTYGDIPPAHYFKFRTHQHWRSNYETVMNLRLPSPLIAQYIRIYPMTWTLACCMRVEFYGCKQEIDNQQCGLGWIEDKATKNCYKFNTKKTTWDAAQSICKADGGDLASITTSQEKSFIGSQLKGLSAFNDFWIGLTDLDTEGFFKWNDHSPLLLTAWYTSYPKQNSVRTNCVSIRSQDGSWTDQDCTSYRNFICKKKYWISGADYYWPLNMIKNGMTIGTLTATAFGNVSEPIRFPVPFATGKLRYALSFNGKNNYLEVDHFGEPCVTNPTSTYCTHGISVSLLFKYTDSLTTAYLLDSMAQQKINTGYYVYFQSNKLYVYLRGSDQYYTANVYYNTKLWNHFAFTWSKIDGLNVYINGELKGSHRGWANIGNVGKEKMANLFIGKSPSQPMYAKVFLTSLAMYEKVLSLVEVKRIYNTEFGLCKWGQIAMGSFCYEFNAVQKTWSSAKYACSNKGGNLMSVHSPDEQALLSLSAKEYGLGNEIWIGLNSKTVNHLYEWVDGSPVSFTFWNKYEPNNWSGRREDCVHTTTNGFWNDDLCYLRKAYACKYERVHSPFSSKDNGSLEEFTEGFYSYQTKSFGCPLSKSVRITKVDYGSATDKCLISNEVGKKFVQLQCKRHTCHNIRSSDSFFNNSRPCLTSLSSYKKKLIIKYQCPDDDTMPDNLGCPAGYTAYLDNTICYRLYQNEVNLTTAKAQCEKDKGHLASIASGDEELFLTMMTSKMFKKSDIWIGMKYDPLQQKYIWQNGNPVVYTNWFNTQPDPRVGKYVSVSLLEGPQQFLYWKPTPMDAKLPFLCRVLKALKTERPPTTSQKVNGSCPTNWTKLNDYCYFINKEGMSYVDAQEACSKLGSSAKLASIMNSAENDHIYNDYIKANVYFIWLGLSNEAIFSGFSWLDGNPLSYINWYTGRPNTGLRHLCGGMSNGGKWWDLPCYSRYPSICKVRVDSVYQPTTTPAPTTTTTQDPSLCKKGWSYFNKACYFFSNNGSVDYHAAKLMCENMDGHLTSISNNAENLYLKNQISRRYGSQAVYIGLTDRSSEGGWEWEDGSVANYFNFDVNQPDDWHGMEDCTEMRPNGKWNDLSCNLQKPFICKNGTTLRLNTTASPDIGYCKNGWVLYGKKCYLFKYGVGNRRKFDDASRYCVQAGGSLVSIHSNHENSFIMSQLYGISDTVFIGLHDKQVERKFLWIDQTSVDYTNWYTGQPSRYNEEDCVELMPYFKYHGRWNDIHCSKETGFVCQSSTTESKPTATTTAPTEPCPKGYKKYRKSCYIVHSIPKTWEEARSDCIKVPSGDLVSLHSPHEQAFVFSQFVEYAQESWIGLRKMVGSRTFVWSDNTTNDYSYWKPGYSRYSQLRCAAQVFSADVDGKWKALNCTNKLPYTCKISRADPTKESPFIGNCSNGWEKVEDRCIKLFSSYSDQGTWAESEQKCKGYGGDLVTVDSEAIQSAIRSMIQNSWRTVWIGLNDRRKEHVFEWASGKSLQPDDFTNWGSNEPNDNSGAENCVEMTPTSGKWNDLPCFKKGPFVCEHTLECRSSLGMENMMIPDISIKATSYTGMFEPKNARLNKKTVDNKDTAWCTNTTDKKQSLTINLGSLTTITRINTQGLYQFLKYNSYVITYLLDYSMDGQNWKHYEEDEGEGEQIRRLPGNKEGRKIEGTTVNLKAVYLRFTPTKFKGDLVCMRLELYGCKAECVTSIGMTDYKIPSTSITVSSKAQDTTVDNVRPIFDKAWCAQSGDKTPWLKIDLFHTMKITRILGLGEDDNNIRYNIKYSDYDVNANYTFTKTIKGGIKEFSTKESSTYDLEVPIIARHVKFILIHSNKGLCLQVELYGCPYECTGSLGMESGRISKTFLSASSQLPGFPANEARLNGKSAWCAKQADGKQYLQVNFKQTARITAIATQGFVASNVEKFVTEYEVQWSTDGKFWTCLKQNFIGNTEGVHMHKVHLDQSILTRYLRIVPTGNVNGICMRVELYGCALRVMPTMTPLRRKQSFYGSVRLTNEIYNEKLKYENSLEYEDLTSRFKMAMSELYANNPTFNDIIVKDFQPGSVVVNFVFVAMVSVKDNDPLILLKETVSGGTFGEFEVDKSSLAISTTPDSKKQESSDSGGLSNGAKVGLIIFFLLIIILVLIGGGVYYCKRHNNGFKLAFAHKSFENPIHMSSSQDEMNIEFVNHADD